MSIKNTILSLGLSVALGATSFAAAVPASKKPQGVAVEKIQKIIDQLDLERSDVATSTVKLKFMVNENNEIIVLSTGDSKIDGLLKGNLNYKSIDSGALVPYKVYILPIRFEGENS
ncbi:MAG: hypothetical protein AAFQ02_04720 [Bacteroidota bacterium]